MTENLNNEQLTGIFVAVKEVSEKLKEAAGKNDGFLLIGMRDCDDGDMAVCCEAMIRGGGMLAETLISLANENEHFKSSLFMAAQHIANKDIEKILNEGGGDGN